MIGEVIILLLGEETPTAWWVAAIIWASIGSLISIYIKAEARYKYNPETPNNFSIRFFLLDNLVRMVMNIFVIISLLRFAQGLLGMSATLELAFFLGLISDQLIKILQYLQNKARDNYLKF